MLTAGTLHPSTFNYPSLPKYIAAGSMAVGFLRDAGHLRIKAVQDIGNVGYPHYDSRGPMETARQTFALLSVIALGLTGFCGWLVHRRPMTILLAPLMLVSSPLFFYHSWAYLNVDIVGTCFVVSTLALCLQGTEKPSLYYSAFAPGAFAGLATGSKYNLAVVILPVLVAIWLYEKRGRRVRASLIAIASMILVFLAVVPYSIIDIPGFLNGLGFEVFHYAVGHAGYEGTPGLPQLFFYLQHFAFEFGVAGALLAVIGLGAHAVTAPRRTAVLLAFPVATLWLLSVQRVHFTRNVLAVHPMVAIFASIGVRSLHEWLLRLLARTPWSGLATKPLVRHGVALALIVLAVPFSHVADLFRDRTDSRNVASAWLASYIPAGWTIVIPAELGFDERPLDTNGRQVLVVDQQSAIDGPATDALLADVVPPAVILVPTWGADPFVPGRWRAPMLNDIARRWSPVRTFGTEAVWVNHENHVPFGNPAFSVDPFNLPPQWITWLQSADREKATPQK
jgi:hypothetical protein